jgi:hypothetical protein
MPALPLTIENPDVTVAEFTVSAEPPTLATVIPTGVESVVRRTSPKFTEVGWTSMSTGGSVPVPFSVTSFVDAPLLSEIVTVQATAAPTVGENVAVNEYDCMSTVQHSTGQSCGSLAGHVVHVSQSR